MCLGFSLEYISNLFLRYEQYDKQIKKLEIQKQRIDKQIKNLALNKQIKKLASNKQKLVSQKSYKKKSPFTSLGKKRDFSTSIILSNENNINNSNSQTLTVKGERKREIKLDYKTNNLNIDEPSGFVRENLLNDSLILTFLEDLGNWSGWYFSEELYNAQKYGYNFKILKGYTFDKAFIFKDYVEKLYEIKESHPKGSPMNLNAKLLLNSLYGRFGMTPYGEEHIILPSNLSNQFILDDKFEILDVIDFKNNKELISYKIKSNPNVDSNFQDKQYKNVSIVVASAITAYGRIHMSQFKNNKELGQLLYTDTDCIAITGDMNDKYIGKGLGQMELEKKWYGLKNKVRLHQL